MSNALYSFIGDEFVVEFNTLQQAEENSCKFPSSVFRREGKSFRCIHQEYLQHLAEREESPEELRKEQEERRKELILKESDPPSKKVERELKNAYRL